MRKFVIPALAALASAVACLCLAAGGCRRAEPERPVSGAAYSESSALATPTASAGRSAPPHEIGDGSDLVGRLEKPVVVRATLFHAGETVGRESEVRLAAGTWLVPGPAIAMPPAEEK